MSSKRCATISPGRNMKASGQRSSREPPGIPGDADIGLCCPCEPLCAAFNGWPTEYPAPMDCAGLSRLFKKARADEKEAGENPGALLR